MPANDPSAVPPLPVAPVLNYSGPTVPSRPAFNARRTWSWKGEHLFRVYLTPGRLWFVRIGGGQTTSRAVGIQFGLLGALLVYFASQRAKRKAEQKVIENESQSLDVLMAGHKLNHVIAAEDVIDPRIEASGLFGAGPVRLSFNLRGQKKRVNCNLESADNVTDAIRTLAPVLPNLRVNVRYDEQKNKYRKVK